MPHPQLMLAFDAHCSTCRRVARTVEQASSGRVTVLPLDHPQIRAVAPTATRPTLVYPRRDGSLATADGPRMGAVLVRHLGTARTVQVVRALGRLRRPGDEETTAMTFSRRGMFELGAGGALAVGMLGAGAGVAAADGGKKDVTVKTLTGSRRVDALDALLDQPDLANVAGADKIKAWKATRRSGGQEVDGLATYGAGASSYRHASVTRKEAGARTVTVDLVFDDETETAYLLHRYDRALSGVTSRADAFHGEGETIHTLASSFNGMKPKSAAGVARSGYSTEETPCGGCYWPGDGHTHGHYQIRPCDAQFDAACVLGFAGCVGCTAACAATFGVGCWFCLITSCGSYILGCCGDGGAPVCVDCPDGE